MLCARDRGSSVTDLEHEGPGVKERRDLTLVLVPVGGGGLPRPSCALTVVNVALRLRVISGGMKGDFRTRCGPAADAAAACCAARWHKYLHIANREKYKNLPLGASKHQKSTLQVKRKLKLL